MESGIKQTSNDKMCLKKSIEENFVTFFLIQIKFDLNFFQVNIPVTEFASLMLVNGDHVEKRKVENYKNGKRMGT